MGKCETCINRYAVISENGMHYNCSLSERNFRECIFGKKEHYIKHPAFKEESEGKEEDEE